MCWNNEKKTTIKVEVLGPTLFTLYTKYLPSTVTSGSLFMYTDNTTVYCIGDTVDNTVTSLNKALSELNSWCLENSLTPHLAKCEAILLMRKPHSGPLNSVTIGEDRSERNTLIFWVLLSMKKFPGHLTLQMWKIILLTNWTSWKGARSWAKRPIGSVL